MRECHVLLDSEYDGKKTEENSSNNSKPRNDYLLQVFTQPIFDKNTLFLELIQRIGKVEGFGANNIKALWNAVEFQLNKKQRSLS